jgi:hypothetical protein
VLAAYSDADARAIFAARAKLDGKFVPLKIAFTPAIRTTWRQLIRWLLRECGGTATLEQLYELAAGHPKLAANPNWQAKIRQQVQREADRVGPALWKQRFLLPA